MKKITLYKDNRTDQEYELTPEEMKQKFRDWLSEQDPKWLKYYYDRLEVAFVGQGLDSVADDPDGEIKAMLETVKKEEVSLR